MKKLFLFSVLSLFTLFAFADGDIIATSRVTFTTSPTGAINGNAVFSVSASQKVYFSKGNLQWQASTNTWRFAEHQYDVIGKASNNYNYTGTNPAYTTSAPTSSTSPNWSDVFGWGTSGYHYGSDVNNKYYRPYDYMYSNTALNAVNYYGFGPSTDQDNPNINNSNYDWGVYVPISNGGGERGQWRTLTNTEWTYLLSGRPNASNLRTYATVCNKKGLILFPDNWVTISGVTVSMLYTDFTTNTYDATAWAALEASGAAFLPCAGYRYATYYSSYSEKRYWFTADVGYYWTSTSYNYQYAYRVYMSSGSAPATSYDARYNGYSVRLVQNKAN